MYFTTNLYGHLILSVPPTRLFHSRLNCPISELQIAGLELEEDLRKLLSSWIGDLAMMVRTIAKAIPTPQPKILG